MRHPRRAGPLRLAVLLGSALLAALPSTAMAKILDELRGRWATASSGPPTMEWAPTEDGFTVSWTPPGAEATTVHFTPTGHPGVYRGTAKAGWSMMDSMFGDDAPANPLLGGPLFWARAADETIFLYRMVIGDQGAFELDRYSCRPANSALDLSLQRRTAEGMAEPTVQRLVRVVE
jgi:hypothetical protein